MTLTQHFLSSCLLWSNCIILQGWDPTILHPNTLHLLKTGSKVVAPVIWNNSSGKSFEIGSNYSGVIFSHLLVLVWQAYKVPSLPIAQPVKVDHTTGVYEPYSFRPVAWVLLRPKRTHQWKCFEMYGFSSSSEKTRKSNHLQMSL